MSSNNISGSSAYTNYSSGYTILTAQELLTKYDTNKDGIISSDEYLAAQKSICSYSQSSTNSVVESCIKQIKNLSNVAVLPKWDEMEVELKSLITQFKSSINTESISVNQKVQSIKNFINALSIAKCNVSAKLSKNLKTCGTNTGKETIKVTRELFTQGFDKYIDEYKSILNELNFKEEESNAVTINNNLNNIVQMSENENLDDIDTVMSHLTSYLAKISEIRKNEPFANSHASNLKALEELEKVSSTLKSSIDKINTEIGNKIVERTKYAVNSDEYKKLSGEINTLKNALSELDTKYAEEIKTQLDAIKNNDVSKITSGKLDEIFNSVQDKLSSIDSSVISEIKQNIQNLNSNVVSIINSVKVNIKENPEKNISDYMNQTEIDEIINALITGGTNILNKITSNDLRQQYINRINEVINKYNAERAKASIESKNKIVISDDLKTVINSFITEPNATNLNNIKSTITKIFGNKLSTYLNNINNEAARKADYPEMKTLSQLDDLISKINELPSSLSSTKKDDVYAKLKTFLQTITGTSITTNEQLSIINLLKMDVIQTVVKYKNISNEELAEVKTNATNKIKEFLSLQNNTYATRDNKFRELLVLLTSSSLSEYEIYVYLYSSKEYISTAQSKQLEPLNTQKSTYEAELAKLDEDNADNESAIKTLKNQIAEIEAKISAIETEQAQENSYIEEQLLKYKPLNQLE